MAVPGSKGKTLHIACMDGDIAAVQRWLDAGNFVDKRDGGDRTGLHQASWSGRTEVVVLLLGAYAEVDARDKQQRTPLHLCSETGHEAVVKVLLDFKAEINAVDTKRETPLSKAARSGMVEVFEGLLAAGADIEIRDADNRIAGDTFNSKVPLDNRQKIIALRDGRLQELAATKAREEAVRLAEIAKTGPREKERANGSGCMCSVS
eukprot:g16182.t1